MIGLLLTLALGAAAQLPKLDLPEKYFACAKDSDCAVAGDACRSCGMPIVVNKKYLKPFAELDRKKREAAGVNPACEACATDRLKLKCVRKKCAAVLNKP